MNNLTCMSKLTYWLYFEFKKLKFPSLTIHTKSIWHLFELYQNCLNYESDLVWIKNLILKTNKFKFSACCRFFFSHRFLTYHYKQLITSQLRQRSFFCGKNSWHLWNFCWKLNLLKHKRTTKPVVAFVFCKN